MPSLEATLTTVLSTADSLRKARAAGNEANTRALLIDPVLSALGWDLFNFEEVEREFRVYDGSFLDYALRIAGVPKLFVEAKALNKALTDKAFIAQTVNYANNEGVLWCVLTNGIEYHVYKSNEPVAMERKLLFQVDLRDARDDSGRGDVLRSLRTLSRDAVERGELDTWGEQVFIDVRTREALTKLAGKPSPGFLRAVGAAVEGPPIAPSQLRASLGRILGQETHPQAAEPVVGTPPPRRQAGKPPSTDEAGQRPKKVYEVAQHLERKPAHIVDLYERLDALAMNLGPDVSRRPTKLYIGYWAGKRSFFTAEIQKARIWIYISLPPSEAQPWVETVMRDATNIGHFGIGATEFNLTLTDQLEQLEPLLRQAYLRNRR
jgi:predicted transport protein